VLLVWRVLLREEMRQHHHFQAGFLSELKPGWGNSQTEFLDFAASWPRSAIAFLQSGASVNGIGGKFDGADDFGGTDLHPMRNVFNVDARSCVVLRGFAVLLIFSCSVRWIRRFGFSDSVQSESLVDRLFEQQLHFSASKSNLNDKLNVYFARAQRICCKFDRLDVPFESDCEYSFFFVCVFFLIS
jgi:hypothetical protein